MSLGPNRKFWDELPIDRPDRDIVVLFQLAAHAGHGFVIDFRCRVNLVEDRAGQCIIGRRRGPGQAGQLAFLLGVLTIWNFACERVAYLRFSDES